MLRVAVLAVGPECVWAGVTIQRSHEQQKMIIPINPPGGARPSMEWVILELNGELAKPLDESRLMPQAKASMDDKHDVSNNIKRRVELGSVKFDADGGPTLIIGNHELKGKAIKLKEPFAVLRKRKATCESNSADEAESESKRMKTLGGVQLEVVGIVKKKLMFDQYPKSIMN